MIKSENLNRKPFIPHRSVNLFLTKTLLCIFIIYSL